MYIFSLFQEEKLRAESKREEEDVIDYLSPYIERLGSPLTLSVEQALEVKNEFIKDFKQTQVDRANNILRSIYVGNQEFKKLQDTLTKV